MNEDLIYHVIDKMGQFFLENVGKIRNMQQGPRRGGKRGSETYRHGTRDPE